MILGKNYIYLVGEYAKNETTASSNSRSKSIEQKVIQYEKLSLPFSPMLFIILFYATKEEEKKQITLSKNVIKLRMASRSHGFRFSAFGSLYSKSLK